MFGLPNPDKGVLVLSPRSLARSGIVKGDWSRTSVWSSIGAPIRTERISLMIGLSNSDKGNSVVLSMLPTRSGIVEGDRSLTPVSFGIGASMYTERISTVIGLPNPEKVCFSLSTKVTCEVRYCRR